MLSGSAEPACCEHPPLSSSEFECAVSGADAFAHDAPGANATKLIAQATIYGATHVTAARWAGSTAVN